MSGSVPVWAWLPGAVEPVHAGTVDIIGERYEFEYDRGYIESTNTDGIGSVALDPVQLRFKRGGSYVTQGLPGVISDAKPAGYGQDRLNAKLRDRYQRDLTDLELLEEGPADGAGAIEVCRNIVHKLAWRPASIDDLCSELERLEEDAPPSRAIRRANGDAGTSAGGERPKATFVDDGSLWLVKMQDRGDRQGSPAMEYLTMILASKAQITVPKIKLKTIGKHQAFMIARFDRAGDPYKPERHLFASAHTVLRLPGAAVRGDPRRSYLVFADSLRVWCRNSDEERIALQHQELWRRMAFNALIGNIDDHPRNHGLIYKDGTWQLSPAFDITPVWRRPHSKQNEGAAIYPPLAMATGLDGHSDTEPLQLIMAAEHFGLDLEVAASYLLQTSQRIQACWEIELRHLLAPLAKPRGSAYIDEVIASAREAFAYSEFIASNPQEVQAALERAVAPRKRGRRRRVR